MTTIKQQTTSELALQKAEDNKKEITYIYSKLKDINIENVKPLIQQNAENIAKNINEIENIKTAVEQNTSQIETLKGSSTTENNENAIEKNTKSLIKYSSNYYNCVGGEINAFPSYTYDFSMNKIYFTCKKSGIYKVVVRFQFKFPISSKTSVTTSLRVNDIDYDYRNFYGYQTKYEVQPCEMLYAYVPLNEGENTLFFNFKEIENEQNVNVLHIFFTIEGPDPIQIVSHHFHSPLISNGRKVLFLQRMLRYGYLQEYDSAESLLTYSPTELHKGSSFSIFTSTTFDMEFMPTLNAETGELEKSDVAYLSKHLGSSESLYNINTSEECLAQSSTTLKFNACAVIPYQVDNEVGLIHVSVENRVRLYSVSSDGTIRKITYLLNIPKAIYVCAPKTLTNKYITFSHFFYCDENFNFYYVPVNTETTTFKICEENIQKIATNIYLPNIYFHNNKYFLFYNRYGVTRKKVFTIIDNVFTEISDTFFSYAQEVYLASPTISLQLNNGFFTPVEIEELT